ncbi:MAG: phasin family protein [Thermoanaerobaculia bacterium]
MRKSIQKVASRVAQSGLESAGESAFTVGRNAWLVSLGLAASAGETGVALFETLVEKGRRRRRTPVQKAKQAIAETGSTMMKLANGAARLAQLSAAEVMDQLAVPTRDDVRGLMRRVDMLRQKLV